MLDASLGAAGRKGWGCTVGWGTDRCWLDGWGVGTDGWLVADDRSLASGSPPVGLAGAVGHGCTDGYRWVVGWDGCLFAGGVLVVAGWVEHGGKHSRKDVAGMRAGEDTDRHFLKKDGCEGLETEAHDWSVTEAHD